MANSNKRTARGVCLLALLATSALARQAEVSGFIRDPSGATVSNATITIKNTATNVRRTTQSNEAGIYQLPTLPPGLYQLTVEATGFDKQVIEDIKLETAAKVIRSIELKVGNTSESVTVSGGGININTIDASVSTVINREFVENIPLNGRSFQSLLTLAPGVTAVPSSRGQGQSGSMSVNGQRTESNYFMVDGVSANTGAYPSTPGWGAGYGGSTPGETVLGTTQTLVSIDALQEFRATTSTYSAEFGRGPGGQFSFTTRGGTNNWHGSLFNYFRNDALDANNWFSNSTRTAKPAQRQNNFGGTLGGPLSIPKVYNGTDRTFFFFSYEGLRLRTPLPAVVSDVPSLELRRTAPAELQMFLNAFPLPNGPATADGPASYTGSFSSPGTLDSTSIRVDHSVSDTFKVFGRYSDSPSSTSSRAVANMSRLTRQEGHARTLTLGATKIVSAGLNNEFRFNFTNHGQGQLHELDTFGGAIPFRISQVPGYSNSDQHWIDIYMYWGLRPTTVVNSKKNAQRQINITNQTNVIAGRHSFKFGIDYRRLATQQAAPSIYQFAIFDTLAQLMQNKASNLTLERFDGDVAPVYTNFSAFAQDEWKVSQRLNLSLGVRWDVNPAPGDQNGNIPYNLNQVRDLRTTKLSPAGTPLFATRWGNVAPRVGIAYRVSQTPGYETVFRTGAGLFYDTVNSVASTGYFGVGRVGAIRFTNGASPFPATEAQFAQLPPGDVNPPYNFLVYSIDPNIKSPYTWQWSAAIEQGLGQSQTLTLSYVGSVTRKLPANWNVPNNVMPTLNPNFRDWGVSYIVNMANASYNSMQVQFQRRRSRGLQATAFYTWSHNIDQATNNFSTNKMLKGNSDYDIRHNFQSAITYAIPGTYQNRLLAATLKNWSLDTRISARSALPVDVIGLSMVDPSTGASLSYQPNIVPGQPLYIYDSNLPGGRRFNFNAFENAPPYVQGSLGRNVMRGFKAIQTDIAVRREFNLTERWNLQFRAEAFNLFNHANFGSIYNQLTNGASRFGLAYSTQNTQLGGLNSLYQIGGPRSLQLALKLRF